MSARFSVGIDLGTTQSALAFAPLDGSAPVRLLEIPQLTAASTVESSSALPSFLYLSTAEEASSGVCDLPWTVGAREVVGEWARRRSAEAPTRTVAAAKSWLCHHRVDRRQPILPWKAPPEVAKISPLTASRRYLEHLSAAWRTLHPGAPLGAQRVVLTVPASFDAGARELTREAALDAGLPEDLILLEEPQAAVYAWLDTRGDAWRDELAEGDVLLVCDVGGGTTDFTLVGVESENGELVLRRLAVGDHLLVGGDNMDLALAHTAQQALAERGVEVDAWQSIGLWHACRQAKESLLAEGGAAVHPVSVLGRGRRLIGGTVSVELERERVASALVDGFFPACQLSARPQAPPRLGFRELGLDYASDTAITRHLAAFLSHHDARPTRLLWNGGVFKAERLRRRLAKVVGGWFAGGAGPPRALEGVHDLDFAVARGAAAYGLAKAGRGIRIRGGTPRAYYLGLETAGLAIPGAPRPLHAVCVAPRGMEEGSEVEVPGGEIGLVVGEAARFPFFSSSVRGDDRPGDVLERWTDGELVESDALEAALPKSDLDSGESFVPVRLRARVTELGMLEIWCEATSGEGRWKMEFSVREG